MTSNKARILFVDDEVDLLNSLQRSLRKKRQLWDMSFVTSAEAALSLFESLPFQVVVTDLSMPGMSGVDLIKNLNQKYPDTHCLMLTGAADLQDAVKLINTTRIFRFYTKPWFAESIAEGISEALAQETAEQELPSPEILAGHFSLTQSEARLTLILVQGKSLEVAAKETGITLSSARTYLKRIFSKTNTNRQAELVSKILLMNG